MRQSELWQVLPLSCLLPLGGSRALCLPGPPAHGLCGPRGPRLLQKPRLCAWPGRPVTQPSTAGLGGETVQGRRKKKTSIPGSYNQLSEFVYGFCFKPQQGQETEQGGRACPGAGQRGASSSRSAGGGRPAVRARPQNPFRQASHSAPTRGASLPGSGSLWAGSRDHPGLRCHSPTGFLHT